LILVREGEERMGRNFLGLIKNGYGEYWYYNGRIFYTGQEYNNLSTK
jgi:hypothetical protein